MSTTGNNEFEIVPSPLPSPIFCNSDLQFDASSDSDIEPVVLGARPSRAFFDGGGWKSRDHYSDDLPQESSSEGWKETYTRMENICVNGAKRRQWTIQRKEIEQIRTRCQVVLQAREDEGLSRGDFSEHFFGHRSPQFILFREELDWDHRLYCKFMATNYRLSANNWTAAKLYDEEHPQDVSRLLQKAEFIQCWDQIKKCNLPEFRELAANNKPPFYESCQKVINTQCRNITVVGRSGRHIYLQDDGKYHF